MPPRFSVGLIIFGSINILVAIAPPCAGVFGTAFVFGDPVLNVKGRDLGPAFKQHVDRELPSAKPEAIGAVACNALVALLLAAGSVGVIFTQQWARWLTIGAAVLMSLTLCIHDVYQLTVFRPSLVEFLQRNMPPGGQPGEREGFIFGFTASLFLWSCLNPLIMVYLLAMSIYLILTGAFNPPAGGRVRARRRAEDDDDDYRYGRR